MPVCRVCVFLHEAPVREEDWLVESASKCQPSVTDLAYIPRLNAKFQYYSLERQAKHMLDLTADGLSAALFLLGPIPIAFCGSMRHSHDPLYLIFSLCMDAQKHCFMLHDAVQYLR